MKDWLKRQGFVYKKPKTIPGKLNPEKQKEFIEEYNSLKAGLNLGEEIHFVDAVHPQHQSEAMSGWIKLQTTGKHLKLHFGGAFCLQGMQSLMHEYETVDAQAIIDFLSG